MSPTLPTSLAFSCQLQRTLAYLLSANLEDEDSWIQSKTNSMKLSKGRKKKKKRLEFESVHEIKTHCEFDCSTYQIDTVGGEESIC